jgi:hypothetical protein
MASLKMDLAKDVSKSFMVFCKIYQFLIGMVTLNSCHLLCINAFAGYEIPLAHKIILGNFQNLMHNMACKTNIINCLDQLCAAIRDAEQQKKKEQSAVKRKRREKKKIAVSVDMHLVHGPLILDKKTNWLMLALLIVRTWKLMYHF